MKPLNAAGSKKNNQLILISGLIGLLATGCQTYQQQNKIITNWQQGNLPAAAAEAQKMADNSARNKDAIIWRLEQGAVLRANGQYTNSNDAFDKAQAKIDDYAQKAKIRVGQEAGALLSNQANLAYEGRAYDGIMLNTYKALNYLALGEPDKARPEIIRAYQRQQDAVEANKKRIQETQDAAAKNKDKAAIEKAQGDQKLQTQLSGATTNLNGLTAYADYVNPFTVYLDGLFFLVNAADASDLERAHKSFERVTAFAPDNEYIKEDLATVDYVMDGHSLSPTTYLIFETGCAPQRSQIRIDIPIIVTSVSYVGVAFPTLKLQENYIPQLTATFTGASVTTKLVANMDGIIGLDFKNELPVVITKTIASTVTKAVAAYAINQAANQQSWEAGLISQIATGVAQAAVNIADERTWTTLPKEFQVAHFPTPADHKIVLSFPGSIAGIPVTLDDSLVNIIYVKSINANASVPLIVTKIKLDGSPLVTTAPVQIPKSQRNTETNLPVNALLTLTNDNSTVTNSPLPDDQLTPTNPPAATEIITNQPVTNSPAVETNAPAVVTNSTPVAPATISNPQLATYYAELKLENPRLVIEGLKGLRQLHATEAVPQVLPLLHHYDFNVVRNACRTLAVIGNKDNIPDIEPLLQNSREDVQRDAKAAILALQGKS